MKTIKNILFLLRLCTMLVMMAGMLFPSGVAIAQDETPPPDPEPAESSPADSAPADPAPVEPAPADPAPAAGEPVPVVAEPEAPAVEATEPPPPETAPGLETEVPTDALPAPTEAPAASEPAPEPTPLAEVVKTISESNVEVVDESGNALPMADQAVADALTNGDPYYDDGTGTIVGYTTTTCPAVVDVCNVVASNPLQAAITNSPAGADITVESGTYNITTGGTINKSLTLSSNVTLTNGGSDALFNVINLMGTNIVNAANNIFAAIVNVFAGADIQTGIDMTQEGGTTQIKHATFALPATLNVHKRITIRGDGGNMIIAGVGGGAPTLTGSGTAMLITSSDVKIEGLIFKGFENGIVEDVSSKGDHKVTITNNTFLNNTKYDIKVLNSEKDTILAYNAFLDIDPITNLPMAFGGVSGTWGTGGHHSYAVYQSENNWIKTTNDFWGCPDAVDCGPMGYTEVAGVISPAVVHAGQSSYDFPAGIDNTVRQGIVFTEDGIEGDGNGKVIFFGVSEIETIIPGCTDPQALNYNSNATFDDGTCTYCATQKPHSHKVGTECVCDTGYEEIDGVCVDNCPLDPLKTQPGVCGCGVAETDTDGDGTLDCNDQCPNDAYKVVGGVCGCGVADTDSDGDGTANCNDQCPYNAPKTEPGICGCSIADTDTDGDSTVDCLDGCMTDPLKFAPGSCGCGVADTDTDGDGTADCKDVCLNDPLKTGPGVCGCGVPDTDVDLNGIPDCLDIYGCMDPEATNYDPRATSALQCVYKKGCVGEACNKDVEPVLGYLGIPVTGAGSVIVAGLGHTCMTTDTGKVLCWGLNDTGQDGDGTITTRLTPVFVEGLENVVNLTAGSLHTCALKSDGSVWCWGDNKSGQIGDGTTMYKTLPVPVSLPAKASLINAGQDFTCAMLMNGELWCWGQNGQGQLNDGTITNQTKPVKVVMTPPDQISGGLNLLLGRAGGKVSEWLNGKGKEISGLNATDISSNRFAAGGCAVASGSKVSCWIGSGSPAEVSGTASEVKVETGMAHACAVNSDNNVGCWGSNKGGELGDGTNADRSSAVAVKNLGAVYALAVGGQHACTITAVNSVMCWGMGNYGQLGGGLTDNSNVPVRVILP